MNRKMLYVQVKFWSCEDVVRNLEDVEDVPLTEGNQFSREKFQNHVLE
jgi:hypothetical protein